MKYRLRAESSNDVSLFIQKTHWRMNSFSMLKYNKLPDIDFQFETDLKLEEIILILKDIEDSHVMYQTVKPIEEYTGDRDYNL